MRKFGTLCEGQSVTQDRMMCTMNILLHSLEPGIRVGLRIIVARHPVAWSPCQRMTAGNPCLTSLSERPHEHQTRRSDDCGDRRTLTSSVASTVSFPVHSMPFLANQSRVQTETCVGADSSVHYKRYRDMICSPHLMLSMSPTGGKDACAAGDLMMIST